MKALLLILLLFILTSTALDVTEKRNRAFEYRALIQRYNDWARFHGKDYKSVDEYEHRFGVFVNNVKEIDRLNKEHERNDVLFEINYFADLTQEEFRRKILMSSRAPSRFPHEKMLERKQDWQSSLPEEFDYSGKGVVTAVRDQGGAGTCWAFSAVQNIESQWALKTKKLIELSVEQVVDCDSTQDQNQKKADCGVFGGWPYLAYGYVKKVGGIQTESDYSYCVGLGGDKGTCYVCPANGYNKTLCGPPVEYCNKSDSCDAKIDKTRFVPGLKVSDWSWVEPNETKIADALMNIGPLSVAINAATLQFYRSGVWDPVVCDPKSLDHAVLITGFGRSSGLVKKDYWRVKNSWGRKWGEDGYFRIARGKGKCGIDTQVTTVHLQ